MAGFRPGHTQRLSRRLTILFRKKRAGERRFTRVFFTTDVHGSTDCFKKFLNTAKEYQCDVLVLGGDITGKQVIPIVQQDDGTYRATFLGNDHSLGDWDAVAGLQRLITRSGGYGYVTDSDSVSTLATAEDRHERIEQAAHDLMLERVREWVRLAEERLGSSETRVFVSAGNDDPFEVDRVLDESDVIVRHDGKVVRIDDHHEMIGVGYANQTPWNCPRDIEEDELHGHIDELAQQVDDMERSIFCIHVPPVDSGLDTCPRLDASVYPPRVITDGAGQPVLFGAGSVAVRDAIKRFQPLVGLHGHIHESRGVAKIGRTTVFNPGSEYGEGILRGVILNLTEDVVLSYQFTSG
jgi:uncharacterized protein